MLTLPRFTYPAASLLFIVSCVSAATTPEPPKLRLSRDMLPTHYTVDLTIVPGQDKFKGIADIAVNIQQPGTLFWLNATQLDISEARLGTTPATIVPGGEQFVGLRFPSEQTGSGTLHIVYEGKISNSSSAGVFQLKDRGQPYVYTQFEPTDARRAFPCFDEPNFKVPWQLTLHVRESDMALSNTPQLSEAPGSGGMKTVRFAETKPLPSYLIAFAVGPFDAVSAGKVGKTPLRIIVPKGRGPEAKFAAESIPQLLKLLEDYFGTPYPYPKLDSIVMPIANFAMENVGLITYGQSLLLSKPDRDSISRQRMCAVVTAHEMAHQWFGDWVTTSWWNDIWLNEAFATWMENKITGEWKPDWNMSVTQVDDRLGAEGLDSLLSARKIRQPIEAEDDIANAFDGITYQKGAAVIEMFEHWIGSDTFRKGVRQYIKAHENGNATTADFEAAISAAAGKDIAPAFNSFLDQAGVPMVTTTLNCGGKQANLDLTQSRSLPIGSEAPSPQTWQIPVCVKYQSGGETYSQCELLTSPKGQMQLKHGRTCPSWVLGNNGEVGYYRVNYKGDLLNRMLETNNVVSLSVAERVGLLGDVSSLVDSGQLSPKVALSVVPRFSQDPDHQVVDSALQIAMLVKGHAVPDNLQRKGSAYLRDVFGKRALALGWQPQPSDDENTRLLRVDLVPQVAREGEQRDLIAEAEKLARAWLSDHKAVSPELTGSVLRTAAEYGDSELFDRYLAAAKQEQDPHTRETLIRAMGSFRDPALVKREEELLLTNTFDQREMFYAFLFGPLQYPETRDMPFNFVKANLDALLKKLPREVGGDFAAMLPDTGSAFCDETHRDEVKSFFQDKVKDYTGGPRNLAHTIEEIDVCIARKHVLGPDLAEFLRSQAN